MAEKKRTSKKKLAGKPLKKESAKLEEMQMREFEKKVEDKVKCKIKEGVQCNGTGGFFYFLGFLGALIYYVSTAPSFWDAVLGFFKAIVWPAFLVYGLLLFIGA